mgnify:CR=1 FL=1
MIHSLHDAAGNRIAEYDYDESLGTSTLIREYIWADGMVVAVVEAGQMYFVRTDHIGRPVFATDDLGAVVWEASYLPFGGVQTSTGANANLRFPGQWFQSETALHQNWMRDYDPTTGRYMQADPLGLVDGASVYGYARQNPGRYVDPRGEFGIPGAVAGAVVGGVAGYISSGCWKGAVIGAGFGAVTGGSGSYLTWLGAAATGTASAAGAQVASNYFATGCGCANEEPRSLKDLVKDPSFWAVNFGAGIGAGFGAGVGGAAANYYGKAWYGSGPNFGKYGTKIGSITESISEGIGAAGGVVGELGGAAIVGGLR